MLRVLEDHATFSNEVSAHRSVPNGMDPPEHTMYRRPIEPYFSEERMRAFESDCRTIASKLVQPLADEDIASILRNWTAGELGSLAAGVGIITAYLAAPLARLELWIATETLLRQSRLIECDGDAQPAVQTAWPANGWRSLQMRLTTVR